MDVSVGSRVFHASLTVPGSLVVSGGVYGLATIKHNLNINYPAYFTERVFFLLCSASLDPSSVARHRRDHGLNISSPRNSFTRFNCHPQPLTNVPSTHPSRTPQSQKARPCRQRHPSTRNPPLIGCSLQAICTNTQHSSHPC